MSLLIEVPTPDVVGVVTFGSYARGNATANSDIDVCVFVDDLSMEGLNRAHDNELTFLKPVSNLEISIYDRRTAEYMAKTGSLFLWHLKLEGHIEYQKDSFVTAILASLSKCPDTLSELDVHKRLFYLILARRRDGEIVDIFDMSAAHTIVRNICILLCAYAGQFRFGRTDAFEKAREIYGDIGVSAYNFELMLGYHLLYQRGIEPSLQVDEGTVDRLLADVGRFVDRAKSILEVPL